MTDAVIPIEETTNEPGPIRLVMTLVIAGFFSALALASVYIVTKPIIENNKKLALQEAIFRVVPECSSYKTLILNKDNTLSVLEGKTPKDAQVIFAGYKEDKSLAGFAIPGEEPGFQDLIVAIYGYVPGSKDIVGFEVLDSKETPGLGDKIMKDENFKNNFQALHVEPEIVAIKPGEKSKNNQVETITGATISSKTVVRLLDKSMKKWKTPIENWLKQEEK